jgi:RNA polymerase sigma factor (sigma-70 family)
MVDPSTQEVKLTPDLIEYAKAVALKVAPKYCGPRIDYDDVVQEAILHLLRRPPKFDPSRGAKVKTFIYTIVERAVMRYAEREHRYAAPLRRFKEPAEDSELPFGPTEEQMQTHRRLTGKGATKHEGLASTVDEMLRYIDSEESRALCRLVLECEGNLSKAAERMKLSEGTVRYRLKLLGPKLRQAGFNPFGQGGAT